MYGVQMENCGGESLGDRSEVASVHQWGGGRGSRWLPGGIISPAMKNVKVASQPASKERWQGPGAGVAVRAGDAGTVTGGGGALCGKKKCRGPTRGEGKTNVGSGKDRSNNAGTQKL